ALARNALRHRVLQPSGRRLPGRLARRPPVRPLQELRHRVVAQYRDGRVRRDRAYAHSRGTRAAPCRGRRRRSKIAPPFRRGAMLDLSVSLDDKYRRARGPVFMNGTQALVRLAMLQAERDRAAGLNTAGFVSGYRGSPLAALDFELWRAQKFLEPLAIKFHPGLNEDLAATSVWGTQQIHFYPRPKYDGVFAMWYGKSPGVDRCGDAFKHANHAGTTKHGGVLALIGDDHAQKSTSTTSQSEYAMMDAMIPVLAPADIQEFIDLGLFGFALSRYAGLWVAMKLVDSNIGASGTVVIDPDRPPFALPNDFAMPPDGVHARWPDDRIPQEWRLKHVKLPATLAFARANSLDRIVHDSAKPRLRIAPPGKAWLAPRP